MKVKVMTYRMFIDDERLPFEEDFVVVRNMAEAKRTIDVLGFPGYVSFDHDLGENQPTGYDFVKWLIEKDQDVDWWYYPSRFEWFVHSQNPVGKENIEKFINNYYRHKFR